MPEGFQPIIAATTPDVEVAAVDNNHLSLDYLSQYLNVHIDLALGEPVMANLLGFGAKEVAIWHKI